MSTLTAHAGLLDGLGSVLRGESKNETPTPEAAPHNIAQADRGLARVNPAGGKRVALVIGNGNYRYSDTLRKLANPTHDAEDIAKALRGFGFEVIEEKDQSLEGMSDAITEFSRKLGNSEAALFYFAGHGMQVSGKNYIIPVDAKIETEAQVAFKSIDVNMVLSEMDNGKSRINIVMLDACRNNDFSGKFRSTASRGLAAPSSQPKGTVIVYATDPGNIAADGNGRNGLFTAGLLTAFKGDDLSLQGVLTRASEEVERDSGQKQTPYVNGPPTLQRSFQFSTGQGTQLASLEPVPAIAKLAARIKKSNEEIEDDTWSAAEAANTADAINAYLIGYPKGRYVVQAKVKLAALKTPPAKPADPVVSPVARIDAESDLWNEVQKGGTIEDYQAYLGKYPKGRYTPLAKARLKKIDDDAAQQAKQEREAIALRALKQEQGAWDSANSSPSESSYQGYLNSYPKGRYAVLAQARIAKFKREAQGMVACVFPGSSAPAPGWICDEPVDGYEITATGIASGIEDTTKKKLPAFQYALLDAIVQISQQMKVQVQNMTKQYEETTGAENSEVVDRVNTSVTKQITSAKLGSSITVQNMVKQYLEVTGKGKDEIVDRVETLVSKLEMRAPCAYAIKGYIEVTGQGASEAVDESSGETGKRCTVKDLIKEFSSAGLNVVDTVKSPAGDLFLLLGAKKISELKISY